MPKSEEKTPLLRQNVPKYQRQPPPVRRPTRALHISISLLILAAFVLYAQKHRIGRQGKSYTVGGQALPEWYAICSKEGRQVYTVPAEGGVGAVEYVVVGGKEVVDTGSLARVRRKYGDKATIGAVDAAPEHIRRTGGLTIIYLPPGHTLTPGLTDSHAHPLQYGHTRQLQLQGSKSIPEVISRIEHFVQTNGSSLPEGSWIEGMGWDQNLWQVKEFPTAIDLDNSPILRGLPISLSRIDVHAKWVSSSVLKQLEPLPDHVEGGQIVRYPDGRPTGVFLDNAMDLIDKITPPWTDAQREMYLKKTCDEALSKGLVGVHDAMVNKEDAAFFRRMADQGRLPIRFYSMKLDNAGDGKLKVKSVKLFADGALGSRGAALLEDYSDKPGWSGFLLTKEEVWEPLIRKWYENGWQVNVHTIGDKANHVILNAIESIIGQHPAAGNERRFRLEHAQIMTPGDLKRAVRLGVIASYQPTHATSDMWYAEDRLGVERLKAAYAWRTYLDLGGRITLGSDFPLESIDPLKGFYAAVTRCAEDGSSPHGPGGWYPEQRLTREEALRGFTVDAAYASSNNITGSLTVGKRFDAVVWDDDLLSVDEGQILEVKVEGVLVDGRLVWGQLRG